MKRLILFALWGAYTPIASAEIFKCSVNGKTSYQAAPCVEEKHETTLNIKQTDPDANAIGAMNREERERQYLEQKLLKSKIAKEQADAAMKRAWADEAAARSEAEARRLDIDQQHQDFIEEEAKKPIFPIYRLQ